MKFDARFLLVDSKIDKIVIELNNYILELDYIHEINIDSLKKSNIYEFIIDKENIITDIREVKILEIQALEKLPKDEKDSEMSL